MREKAPVRGKRPNGSKGERSIAVGNGFKYDRLVATLLQALHEAGTGRDRAGNRQLFYDQDATLRLRYFFTPTVTSLRGLQQRREVRKVQQRWGIARTGVSTRRDAATVFEAARLPEVISELARRAWTHGAQRQEAGSDREQKL